MRSMRALTFTSLVVALLLVPGPGVGQGDDATRPTSVVTFYGHVFATGLDAPMPANTEFPSGEDNYGRGIWAWCTGSARAWGLPPTDAEPESCDKDPNNKLALFSTAGFVDVKNLDEFNGRGGYSLLHNERGQTKDITLDMGRSVTATVFLTTDLHSWSVGSGETACVAPHPRDVPCLYPYWGWDPGYQKDFVVEAVLYSANLGEHGSSAAEAPPIREAIDSGSVTEIARGSVGPMDVTNGLPGSPNAVRFDIDLGPPKEDTLPRSHDFFMVYEFYSVTGGQKYSTHSVRVWSGEFFAPSFTIPVKNALDVERVIPTFAHGKLALLGVVNTPWGSYDVGRVTLTIEDAQGRAIVPQHIQRYGTHSVGHGGHYVPINFTWVWNHHADGLKPGTYTARVSAVNFQGSATAECTSTFTIAPARTDGALPQPGPIQEGVCGQQTASDELLANLTEGAVDGDDGR